MVVRLSLLIKLIRTDNRVELGWSSSGPSHTRSGQAR